MGGVQEMGRLITLASERLGREIGHGEIAGKAVQDHALGPSSEVMRAYFTPLPCGIGRIRARDSWITTRLPGRMAIFLFKNCRITVIAFGAR